MSTTFFDKDKLYKELRTVQIHRKNKSREQLSKECSYLFERCPKLFDLAYNKCKNEYSQLVDDMIFSAEIINQETDEEKKKELKKMVSWKVFSLYMPKGLFDTDKVKEMNKYSKMFDDKKKDYLKL